MAEARGFSVAGCALECAYMACMNGPVRGVLERGVVLPDEGSSLLAPKIEAPGAPINTTEDPIALRMKLRPGSEGIGSKSRHETS